MRKYRSLKQQGENFFIESLLIEERKRKRICPHGHTYNRQNKRCEPLSSRDDIRVNSDRDLHPENGPGYNVWGRTGVNGDGYAWAERNNWGGGSSSYTGAVESVNPYQSVANKTRQKVNRDTTTTYRRDDKRKREQNRQQTSPPPTTVSEAIKKMRKVADYYKQHHPKKELKIPVVRPQPGEFGSIPEPTMTKSRRGPILPKAKNNTLKNPFVIETNTQLSGCPRCGSSRCRCIGNRNLVDTDW